MPRQRWILCLCVPTSHQIESIGNKSFVNLATVNYLHDTVNEGTFGKRSWTIDRFAVIFRAPRGAINVDMIRIKAERPRFDGVVNRTIQHPHSANAGIKGDAYTAIGIEGDGGYFAGTSSAVLIVAIIPWHWIIVVVIDIRAGQWVLFQ